MKYARPAQKRSWAETRGRSPASTIATARAISSPESGVPDWLAAAPSAWATKKSVRRVVGKGELAESRAGRLHRGSVELDPDGDCLGQQQRGRLDVSRLRDRRSLQERVERGSLIAVQEGEPPLHGEQRRAGSTFRAAAQSLDHQSGCVMGAPRQLRAVRGRSKPRRPRRTCVGQARSPLERAGGRVVRPSRGGSLGDAFELSGRVRVGGDRGGCELPRVAFVVAVGEHGCESGVNSPALGRCGAVVDRRADERMREPEVRACSPEQACVLRHGQVGRGESQGLDRCGDRGCVAGVICRDRQRGEPSVLAEQLDAAGEPSLDRGADLEGTLERRLARELGCAQRRRQLEERQWVTAGALDELVGDA